MLIHSQVGAIVNTTSHDFNLKNGAVSKSILTAAGPEIQKEINKKCKGKQLGDIITTHGFKLKCDYVFHGALEKYDKARSPHRQPGIQVTCQSALNFYSLPNEINITYGFCLSVLLFHII